MALLVNPITADGDYDISVDPGSILHCEVDFVAGTGTAKLQSSWDGTTFKDIPGLSFTSGLNQFTYTVIHPHLRLNVASASGLTLRVYAVPRV